MQTVLGGIGWLGCALVFGAVGVRFFRPEWDQYAIYGAWAGLACIAVYAAGQWRDIAAFFRRRQGRYGALATIGVLVAFAIVIAVNYLASRQNKRWDLTEARQNSLSEQTVKVLKGLDAPAKFTVFDRQANLDRFRARLDEYAYQSGQVSTEYVDPDTKPVVARQYNIDAYGTVVVEYKGRRERATSDSEQDLTNALIKVISGKTRSVYFVQGHGEKDPTVTDRAGYSAIAATLKRDNYAVEKLVLAQEKDVPKAATAVVLAGPTSDLLPEEVASLSRYLAKAGKLMVLLDPALDGKTLPNLQGLMHEWGIDVGTNIVVDISGATNDPSFAVAANYPPHPITERFSALTLYPVARSVDVVKGGVNGHTAQPTVETSARSWAEANLETLKTGVKMEADKGDRPGPVTVAAAVSAPAAAAPGTTDAATDADAPKPETRVVVFGDADFASNAYGGVEGNPNLFANAINWLSQQENLIAVRPKAAGDRRLEMSARARQLVFVVALFLMPAAVFGLGIASWWRRR